MYPEPINRSGSLSDASLFTDGKFPNPISMIHCNESNTYRLWQNNTYNDVYMYKGLQYGFYNITRITDTSSATLAASKITVSL